MQFRVIVATDPQTNIQTGPITIHCATKLSAQCKYDHGHRTDSFKNRKASQVVGKYTLIR